MSTSGSRRAVAEIRFGEDRAGVAKVGGRSIHQYWTLLSPHFRDVFLAPQRRSDDGGVSWTWREPAEKSPLTAAELAGVRSRLERGRESFEENPVSTLMNETRSGGASSQEIIDQLTARVKSVADGLAALPDAALSEFVCRTETDVMVHSWGLASAAKLVYPDSLESGVGGVVLFGGKGSVGNDVVIDNAKGLRVARTTTDEAGEFVFTKLAPGRYRVRVVSGPGEFSDKGVVVTVERGEMSRIELRSTSDPEGPAGGGAGEQSATATTETNAPVARSRRRNKVWIVLAVLFFIGGGSWFIYRYYRDGESAAPASQRISTLTPEKFAQTKPAAHRENVSLPGGGLGQSSGAERVEAPADPESQPTVGARASAGLISPAAAVSKIGSRVELSGAPDEDTQQTVPGGEGRGLEPGGKKIEVASSSNNVGAKSAKAPETAGAIAVAATGKSPGEGGETEQDGAAQNPGAMKNEALAGHLSAGKGGMAPESPAGSEKVRKPVLAKEGGYVAGAEKSKEGAFLAPPPGSDAPGSGVAAASGFSSDNAKKGAVGPSGVASSDQVPVAAVTVVEKAAEKSQTASGKEGSETARKETPERPKPSKGDSVEGNSASAAEPKNEQKDSERETGGGQGSSVAGMAAVGQRPTASSTSSTPTASDDDPAEPVKPEGQGSVSNDPLPEKPLPPGLQAMGTLRTGGWHLSVGRDAIIPTQPVPEGDADTAEATRRQMLAATKALLPATLRRPNLRGGLVFKFSAGIKAQPLRWVEERRGGVNYTLSEARAEAGWVVSEPPRNVRLALVYADGSEAARVEFDRDGVARVFVRKEIRAVIWFGAKYADMENANDASLPRMSWQVLRGPLAASAWTNDSRWMDGTVCRLEMVMNGASPAGTRIALVDQASGWLLATELE